MSRRTTTMPLGPEPAPAPDIEALEPALAADDATPSALPPSGPEPNLLHIGWVGRMFRSSRW